MKRACATCGTLFETSGHGRRYCSRPCWPSSRPYAPDPREVPPTGDRAEVLGLLGAAARRGSVAAMKVLLDELTREGSPEPRSIIDQLAARRREQS